MSFTPYQHLEKRFKRIQILRSMIHLLRWDAEVMLPSGSTEIRAEQLSLLETECNELLRSKKTALLLERSHSQSASLDDWQQANLREMDRLWRQTNVIPKRLVHTLHRATTKAEMVWRQAHQENNFKVFRPHLERVLDGVREKARILGESLSCTPYDALLEEHDPGRKTAEIDPLFDHLETHLPLLVQEIIQKQAGYAPLEPSEKISIGKQKELGKKLMKLMGFPFNKGRLDESLHPFTEGTSEDIRITSSFSVDNFMTGMMGVLHETGHAMYDFGLPSEWFFQPVGRDRGMTIHESQALFLEMMIGRSREFMIFAAPWIQKIFAVSGNSWEPEILFQRANRVKKTFIRMNADEATYLLHVLLRYDLEKELFSGTLRIADLPEAWNELFKKQFGIVPENLQQGCLQDSHWPLGYFGYFSTYALGAIIASQLFQTLKKEEPEIPMDIQNGNFVSIFDWLNKKIYCFGSKLSSDHLLQQATGQELNADSFLAYLQSKFIHPS